MYEPQFKTNWPLWLVLWSMVTNHLKCKVLQYFHFSKIVLNRLILLLWEDLRSQYLIDVSQLAVYVLAHLPEQRHWAFIEDLQVEQQWQQALSEWDVLWKREYPHKKPVKVRLGNKIRQHLWILWWFFNMIITFPEKISCTFAAMLHFNGLKASRQPLINVSSLYLDMNHLPKLVSLQIFRVQVIICTNCTKKNNKSHIEIPAS